MGVFDVFSTINADFTTHKIIKKRYLGAYSDGVWIEGGEQLTMHDACVQPLTDQELVTLDIGCKRVSDFRKVYITDGKRVDINDGDVWELPGMSGDYETIKTDIRPENRYAKVI
ncbi:MAG: hypothetical protein ACRC1V_05075, partial [Plesiomonas sp.]